MTEESNENEIKFRAYLLILNSEFPTHRKTEAMEELLKIYNKQQKEIEEKDKLILYMKEKLNNISFEVETMWRKIEKVEKQ